MEAVKAGGKVTLYSRRAKVFNAQFSSIADELRYLADDTVIDGEIVAVDDEGRRNFNLLQNFRSAGVNVMYFVFDVMMHQGKDVMRMPLGQRRSILKSIVRPEDQIGISESSNKPLGDMEKFIRSHGLEGIVAKRVDSQYQPGLRTGTWCKHRLNRGQEFVVGGYVPSPLGVDSLVIGVYEGKELHYVVRVRAGFIPATRRQVFDAIKHLATARCPFANLPEKEPGRWGQGLTAEKMRECVWLKPQAIAEVEFLEWTGADHLRHTKFIRLRDDKDPQTVVRET